MTSISWLLSFLQVESEFELMNNNSSSLSPTTTNVTPSHNDRCIKKRRLSISNIQKSSDSEFLNTSSSTNVHRTPMFLQTFSLVARVNFYFLIFKLNKNYSFFSYLIYVHWILNIHNFQRMS